MSVVDQQNIRNAPRQPNSKPRTLNSRWHREEVPANSAFQKCLKRAEARKNLKKLMAQEKRSKIKTGGVINSSETVASSS